MVKSTNIQKTVRQHFVPNSFQKNFALDKSKCKIVKFENNNDFLEYRIYSAKTDNNFVIRNFHELYFQNMNGLEDELTKDYCNLTENILSRFEGDWANSIRSLVENVQYDIKRHTKTSLCKITQSDMISLISLITTMYYRNKHRFYNLKSDTERTTAYFNILGMQSLFSFAPQSMKDIETSKNHRITEIWNSKMEYVIFNSSKHFTQFNINIAHKNSLGLPLPEDPAMFHETDQYIMGSLPLTPKIQIQFYIDKTRSSNPSGIIPRLHYLTKGVTKIQLKNHTIFGKDTAIVQNDLHAKQLFNVKRKFLQDFY